MELNGSAIITGAAGGIGRAIACKFVEWGCRMLTLVDLDDGRLAETEALINSKSAAVQVLSLAYDLTQDDVPARIVRDTAQRFGRVSYLVNCAGTPGGFATSQNTTLELFDSVQKLNVRASWQLQKAVIQQMLTQEIIEEERGSVVNVGSMVSQVAMPALSAYITSKHAILGLTRADALDFARDQIRVNCVAPGLIDTELGRSIPAEIRHQYLTPVLNKTPMGRYGTADEVANCVAFLSSRLASYVTGACIAIDGGFTAS